MIPWESIRAEYLGGDTTQRALASKYGVSASAIGRKASREHWLQQREQIGSNSMAKSDEILTERRADVLVSLAQISDLLQERLKATLEELDASATPQDMARLASALKALVELAHSLYHIPTETEKIGWERLRIERERLELDTKRSEPGGTNEVRWIIQMNDSETENKAEHQESQGDDDE